MASGPGHYKGAEECLSEAYAADGGSEREHFYLAAAQVHATLALAAATAARLYDLPWADPRSWQDATSSQDGAS